MQLGGKPPHARRRIRTFLSETDFLKANIAQRTLPKLVRFLVEKSQATLSPSIERAFMQDETGKNRLMVSSLRTKCRSLWQEIKQFLSFFDLVRFCRYLAASDEQKEDVNQTKNKNNLRLYFNTALVTRQAFRRTTSQTYLITNCQIPNSLFFPTACRFV